MTLGSPVVRTAARSRRLDPELDAVRELVRGDAKTISPALRDTVTAVYNAWWDKRAPERTRAERSAATAARRRAIAGNWCAGAALLPGTSSSTSWMCWKKHGYRRSDDLHTGRAVGLIWDLARVYEGAEDASHGTDPQPQSAPQAETPAPASVGEAAVVISGDEIKTIMATLNEASDYNRDRAAACADCAGQSCGTCQFHLRAAGTYDRTMAELLLTAEASRAAATATQPEPDITPDIPRQCLPEADKEAGSDRGR